MIKLKKLLALGLSSLTAMCFIGTSNVNATSIKQDNKTIQNGDVNGDGDVSLADALFILDYLKGIRNISNPEVADFNNDGFVSNADASDLQDFLIEIDKPKNSNYTPSKSTSLLNTDVDYYRYDAMTGKQIGETWYTVESVPDIKGRSQTEDEHGIIGKDERIKDYTHSAICAIEVTDINTHKGYIGTGFVASDNSILTAAHVLEGRKIDSIIFFDSDGNRKTFHPNVIDYSIPVSYQSCTDTDYSLITVSDDLSDYNNLDFGYALQGAIDKQEDVYVTGWQLVSNNKPYSKNNTLEMRTGKGRFLNLLGNDAILYYDGDAIGGSSGGPVYTDLIFENEHYYTVVGINSGLGYTYNCGARMCPNIMNLIQFNSK